MTPENISKILSKACKAILDANGSTRLKVTELLSQNDSDSMRLLLGILNSAIEKAAIREKEEHENAERLALEEKQLADELEKLIASSAAFQRSKEAGQTKNVQEYMTKMFTPSKPTRKHIKKPSKPISATSSNATPATPATSPQAKLESSETTHVGSIKYD